MNNPNVRGVAVPKTFSNPKMPSNNITGEHTSVHASHKGSGIKSEFAKPASKPASGASGKQNIPTKNSATKSVPLGTTKHAAGEVPSYLKRSKQN